MWIYFYIRGVRKEAYAQPCDEQKDRVCDLYFIAQHHDSHNDDRQQYKK